MVLSFFSPGANQVAAKVEREIREFVRRDGFSRQQSTEVNADGVPCVEKLNALIQLVAAASTEEIDRAILELQCVRLATQFSLGAIRDDLLQHPGPVINLAGDNQGGGQRGLVLLGAEP